MEQQFKFLVEEHHRGEWTPLMTKDSKGNKKQKRVIITEEQADRLNAYSKEYKIRYVIAEDQTIVESITDELTLLQMEYKQKFDKKAFHGWDIEQLKEKLNETV